MINGLFKLPDVLSTPFTDLYRQVEILSPVAYGKSEFRSPCLVKPLTAITTTPVFPRLFDRVIQTIRVVRTKDVPFRSFMNRIVLRLHSSFSLLV
jgi:hypothetical protein